MYVIKPFRGNNNIHNYIFHSKKNIQFKTSNTYLLLLLLLYLRPQCSLMINIYSDSLLYTCYSITNNYKNVSNSY